MYQWGNPEEYGEIYTHELAMKPHQYKTQQNHVHILLDILYIVTRTTFHEILSNSGNDSSRVWAAKQPDTNKYQLRQGKSIILLITH